MERIDPNDLLLFARVVDEGSFTAAAERLGLPKSTVSRRLSQLEERLGCSVDRNAHHVIPPGPVGPAGPTSIPWVAPLVRVATSATAAAPTRSASPVAEPR